MPGQGLGAKDRGKMPRTGASPVPTIFGLALNILASDFWENPHTRMTRYEWSCTSALISILVSPLTRHPS
jgi:hypothetical protein